jgi:hypothetical protein
MVKFGVKVKGDKYLGIEGVLINVSIINNYSTLHINSSANYSAACHLPFLMISMYRLKNSDLTYSFHYFIVVVGRTKSSFCNDNNK